jgi:CO dehydrogenase nickel-insertion accessory protein CooC1
VEARAALASSKAFWEVAHGLVHHPDFRDWTLIGDLPGGPSHLAQDFAPYAETFLVVVQPTAQSALTARRLVRLVEQFSRGTAVAYVANNVKDDRDVRHVEALVGRPVYAAVPADPAVAGAERIGAAPVDHAPDSPAIGAIEQLIGDLAAGKAVAA